jgi:uncharacterized membrane protein YkoI
MVSNVSRGIDGRIGRVIAMVIATVLSASVTVTPTEADDDRHDAQRAVAAGEVVPLQRLFARIRKDFDGRVLKVGLERENYAGEIRWIYEAKILTASGNVLELEYDARALELLDVEGRYGHHYEDDE